jgi:hypothetical protein
MLTACLTDRLREEGSDTEAIRILERPSAITWDYDEEVEVFYLSVGTP